MKLVLPIVPLVALALSHSAIASNSKCEDVARKARRAIKATFARRDTEIPASVPDGLSDEFSADAGKQRQWTAFARTLNGQVPELDRVVRALRERLMVFIAPNTDHF